MVRLFKNWSIPAILGGIKIPAADNLQWKERQPPLLSTSGINHYLETELTACPLLPRMQTINDYRQKLYNGDVGLLFKKEGSENFPAIDQGDTENGFHAVQASLPGLVSSFAITVTRARVANMKRQS